MLTGKRADGNRVSHASLVRVINRKMVLLKFFHINKPLWKITEPCTIYIRTHAWTLAHRHTRTHTRKRTYMHPSFKFAFGRRAEVRKQSTCTAVQKKRPSCPKKGPVILSNVSHFSHDTSLNLMNEDQSHESWWSPDGLESCENMSWSISNSKDPD